MLGQTTTELSLSDLFSELWKAAQKMHELQEQFFMFYDAKREMERLARLTSEALMEAVSEGIGSIEDNQPRAEMLENLRQNVYVFSQFKTYQLLRQATHLVTTKDGKLKPFSEFRKDIEKLDTLYNVNYLRAEYNHSVGSSQQAAIWADAWENRELFDLQFDATNDQRTRPEHAALEGIVRPVDDPFWNIYYPPLGWNCRCTVRTIVKGDKKLSNVAGKDGSELPEMFRSNVGKQGVVFPEKHPYFSNNEAGKFKTEIERI